MRAEGPSPGLRVCNVRPLKRHDSYLSLASDIKRVPKGIAKTNLAAKRRKPPTAMPECAIWPRRVKCLASREKAMDRIVSRREHIEPDKFS
jgi:hypothetical protein